MTHSEMILATSFLAQNPAILRHARKINSMEEFLSVFGKEARLQVDSDIFKKSIAFIEGNNIGALSIWDRDYPPSLKELIDPPAVLFFQGEKDAILSTHIAGIVGSRRASAYGLSAAMSFSMELASRGVVIASGMARGIDTYAHKGALKAGGRTIAIIGSGFADIYPKENTKLFGEIVSNKGAVISEFPPYMPPLRQNFPRRNRIISALSKALLVIEAAKRSGALITANFSMELGRDVFSLPGQINAQASQGTNMLIYDGAIPLLSVEDVLMSLGVKYDEIKPKPHTAEEDNEILQLLNASDKMTLQDLCCKINQPPKQVLNEIMKLELKGIIERQGPYISRKV